MTNIEYYSKLTVAELKREITQLYNSIYNDGGISSSDMVKYNIAIAQLIKKGIETVEVNKVTFKKL